MNINDLLDNAKYELKFILPGEEFLLKDLFKGYEWKRIKQADKSILGTLFMNYVNERMDIEVIRKASGVVYKLIEK